MATAPATKLMTADEFWDFCARPENANRSFELVDGEVVEMPTPGPKHGIACINAGTLLRLFVRGRKQGYVCGNDSAVLLATNPDTVRGPDVSYYAEKIDFDDAPEKYSTVLPVLAVEVRSPSDKHKKLMQKVESYLKRGVSVVWLIDPQDRTVTICRRGQFPTVLDDEDELSGEPELPGFACRITEFFTTDA